MPWSRLAEIESVLARSSSLAEIASALTYLGRRLMECDGVTFVVNDNGNCHYLDEDGVSPLWKGQQFPAEHCISGWVMKRRQAVVVPNIFHDPRIPQDVYRRTFVKSLLMVPVGDNGEAAIGAYWAEYHDPTEQEQLIVHALARQVATAMTRLQSTG